MLVSLDDTLSCSYKYEKDACDIKIIFGGNDETVSAERGGAVQSPDACPSPVGKLMNTKMKSDNNRQTNSYGMPSAQNKALEPAGSADA